MQLSIIEPILTRPRHDVHGDRPYQALRRAWHLLLAFLVAVVGACGGDDSVAPGSEPDVTGSWSGSTSIGIEMSLTLTEASDGGVSGSGTFGSSAAATAITVRQGTHVFPNLSLTLDTGSEDLIYIGTVVNEALITGKITGQGLLNVDLDLTKH